MAIERSTARMPVGQSMEIIEFIPFFGILIRILPFSPPNSARGGESTGAISTRHVDLPVTTTFGHT